MNILSNLLDIVLQAVTSLANLVLLPIESLIFTFLPDFSNVISYVSSFFNWLCDLIPWAVSYLGLDHAILEFASYVLIFRLSISITAYAIKTTIKWYNILKP